MKWNQEKYRFISEQKVENIVTEYQSWLCNGHNANITDILYSRSVFIMNIPCIWYGHFTKTDKNL